MTTKCPKCSKELKDDYGMVTCPGCGSIVFVDIDGIAQEPLGTIDANLPIDLFAPMDAEPARLEATGPEPIEPHSMAPDGSNVDMNAFLGYTPDSLPGYESPAPESQNDPNDPLGLSAYANSEMSAAKNGPLVMTLIISGIDAKDLRAEIRQALQDSRFGWDTAALMTGIKGGILRIEQISPVKATIIINRIKNLSVRIRWEQSAINEIDPPS